MNWQRVVEDFMEEMDRFDDEASDAHQSLMRRLMREEEERSARPAPIEPDTTPLDVALDELQRFNIETLKGTIDIYADLLRREMQEATRLRAKLEGATR
jgi:hypothetical protein